VDFVTRLHNTARDHRLRVLFPTPIESRIVHVDGHFDVIERAVARPEGQGWAEPPSPTAHQRAFVDMSDGTAGLAVFNRGLPEYEALQTGAGVGVALTLLRCVGWLSRSDLSTRPGSAGPEVATPEAQCLGEYEFHYAVAPHAGTWEAILHDAHAYNAPCTIVTDRTTEGVLPSDAEEPAPIAWEPVPRPAGLEVLPPSASFVTLEPSELVLSALRQARGGSGLMVRCYNPTVRAVTGRLRLLWPLRSAALVNFLGEEQGELRIEEGEVVFEAGAGRIVTIRCELSS
jgi:alpha-mannosidase